MEKKKTTTKTTAKKATAPKTVVAPATERSFTGVVVSTGMQKTLVAVVVRQKPVIKYHKTFKVSKKYHVHDEAGKAKVGDKIRFVECRPISKTKRHRLVEIIKK